MTTTRKLITVALATILFATLPTLLTAAVDPAPAEPAGMLSAVQPAPEPDYPDWLFEGGRGEPDWPALEACWADRFTSPNATPPGCSDAYPLTLWCDWRVGYPDRFWVEQACGRIADWGPRFGESWWHGWDRHPAKDWVARLRAGGQP